MKLSKAAMNSRDRALVQVLWDTGARIEELLTLRIRDVEAIYEGQAVKLHMRKSKTDIRSPLIVRSAPALLNWIENHPLRDNRDALLWVKVNNTNGPMDYCTARKILMDLAKRIKFEKLVNPHNFRKSSASFFSHKLSPSELKVRFGWRQSSKMLDIYCFPDEDKINGRILELEGIKRGEPEKEKDELMPKRCMWCSKLNPAGQEHCSTCNRPLDPERNLLAMQIRDKLDGDIKNYVEENPGIIGGFVSYIKAKVEGRALN